ncbi:MAG TPA: aspartate--tRNA ligase [Dehalococcoidia bacterium]|nr:aspartate--tRNA ligase [Dehalococcoidia bacterium]
MLKSHYCGELRPEHSGQSVTLAAWVHRRRDHGGLIFLDMRDSSGIVQVVINPQTAAEAHAVASEVRNEYVLQIEGSVAMRRPGTENDAMPTGAIEVAAQAIVNLNAARTPPFYINEESPVEELLRLRYRYLDLRRETMHNNIVLRSRVIHYIRQFLNERGFTDIETPILANPTPEGARDYLVPSRVHPGSFYALPQSPQQFKQLLMVSGFERYYQIARCFRDEDLRADRQPEFTQLDLEMSFVTQEDILQLTEALYTGLVRELRPDLNLPSPFPRLTYAECMRRFGSDKPDIRYGLELTDFTELVRNTEFAVFRSAVESGGAVEGLCVPGGASFSRREIDDLTETVKTMGARGLVSIAFEVEPRAATEEQIRSPVLKFLGLELTRAIGIDAGAAAGDLVLIVAGAGVMPAKEPGSAARVKPALDTLRRTVAAKLDLADPNTLAFLWVVDFPMFEWDDEEERWSPSHHLFTSVKPESLSDLETDAGRALSNAYDIVCNGQEIGSGSIRIHDRSEQERILRLLKITDQDARERFGHMLEAFEYGAPPHGGIAPGIDRTVALLAQESDIREVIPFPKTKSASDPMTGAPSPAAEEALRTLNIAITATEA